MFTKLTKTYWNYGYYGYEFPSFSSLSISDWHEIEIKTFISLEQFYVSWRHHTAPHGPSLLVTCRLESACHRHSTWEMATKVGRKRQSLIWDFFEYDGEKDKSKCLVVETGDQICGIHLKGKRTNKTRILKSIWEARTRMLIAGTLTKWPLLIAPLKEKQHPGQSARKQEGGDNHNGLLSPTTKQLLVSKLAWTPQAWRCTRKCVYWDWYVYKTVLPSKSLAFHSSQNSNHPELHEWINL